MKLPFGKQKNNTEQTHGEPSAAHGFFENVSKLFQAEPQKEKVLRHEDFNGAGDTYYATVSAGYKISQRILVLILVIFLLLSLVINFGDITYDNFFYLIKDFSAAMDIEQGGYDVLPYNSDSRHFFALYRGGLTVVNPSSISAFTATGRRTLDLTSKFSSPCVESSSKYFLVYDTSGNTFSVYNSFARIYTETLDYPVTAAAFADDGTMAVVTRDISHKSLVHIYNKNFKRLFTVPSSDKYAFAVKMSSEYDRLVTSYYDIGDGSGRTQIVVRKLTNMEEVTEIFIDGEFLLDCGFIDGGKFAVVTDRCARIYDINFDEIEAYNYENGVISGYQVSEQGMCASYTLNSKNFAIVFDKSGKLLYNEIINDNIKDIGIFGEYVFLRTDSGVIRIDAKSQSEQFLSSDQGKMLIYSADTALVCGDAKAEYLVFDEQ